MSGKTDGRRAYDAWWATAEGVPRHPDVTYDQDGDAWEAAAAAGAASAREHLAELVTEGNELRAEVYRAHAETRSLLARMDARARELEASAARTAPSKKSEIEAATAKRLRAITCTDPAIDPPAVVTAGTGHLAEKIRGLAIGGEDAP